MRLSLRRWQVVWRGDCPSGTPERWAAHPVMRDAITYRNRNAKRKRAGRPRKKGKIHTQRWGTTGILEPQNLTWVPATTAVVPWYVTRYTLRLRKRPIARSRCSVVMLTAPEHSRYGAMLLGGSCGRAGGGVQVLGDAGRYGSSRWSMRK